MSRSLVRLPSLDLIRGFVAVGCRMSITLAARDLCLTQSAVSQQIHGLETALGCKLLVRGHRSIAFTPEGERLFRSADSAVQQLQNVVGELMESIGRQTVTVTSTIGVTGLWLIPRLSSFLQENPNIEIRLSANTRIADLKAEGIDLAIRYGAPEAAPENAIRLFDEAVAPVANPLLGLTGISEADCLKRQVLLEFDGPYRPWLQWGEWLASQGWEGVRPKAILRFNQYDQLIYAAMAGHGIALGRLPLLSPMLADGRLRVLGTPKTGPGTSHYAYWLIQAEREPRPEVLEVMRWIQAEAATPTKSLAPQGHADANWKSLPA